MNELVEAARRSIPDACEAKTCSRDGCSVRLGGLGEDRIFVDMDCDDLKIPADQQRCDFMLVGAGNWVAPIELKSGNVELHDAVRQLQVGARLAERHLVPRKVSPRFRPVVVYGGRFRGRKGKKATRAETVQFRGNAYEVKAIRCGSPLIKALG